MNDKEAIDMMQRCLHEIRDLRAQIQHLSPMADAYVALRDVVRLAAPRQGATSMGQDVIWTLQKRIRELEPKPEAPKGFAAAKPVSAVSPKQQKLDASVSEEQAADYVRKEHERNANRGKAEPVSSDGFINDYD